MSLLKRFGAMGLNWFKKTKTHVTGQSSLRKTLFLQPLTIMVISFALIFLLFNLVLYFFTEDQAHTAIQTQFDYLDRLYVGQKDTDDEKSNIFETTYLIVDSDFNIQYASTGLYAADEEDLVEDIADYIYESDDLNYFNKDDEWSHVEKTQSSVEVTIDGFTYLVYTNPYHGKMKDYYVQQDNQDGKLYYAMVFANITPIANMDSMLNKLLLALFVFIGLGAIGVIYVTTRKVDSAFRHLATYVTKVGRREEKIQLPLLPYQEFNQMVETVGRMDHMIEASERSQKIFFQNASHELRTPLMSIQGYAEGIKAGIIKDSETAAGIIYDESQKMAELVNDILTLSKMETSHRKLTLESLNLSDLLYDVSWRLKGQADDRGVKFEHDFQLLTLEGDERLLERAFSNILSNAVRYAQTLIQVHSYQRDGMICVEISNDGPPVLPEDREHLFERFYKGPGGQFGIGLSITKDIIERHGGQVDLQSTPEKTTFLVTLPASY